MPEPGTYMSKDDNIRKLILLVKIGMLVQLVTLLLVGFFVFAMITHSDKSNSDYQQELAKYHQLIDDWKKPSIQAPGEPGMPDK